LGYLQFHFAVFRFQLDLQGLLFGSQSSIKKEGDDDFWLPRLRKWRGELGWPAGNKQATKFAANFQLFDLGIYLSHHEK
jgi:hypothetical protein